METYYRPELKTISWIPRELTHFLNSIVVKNIYIWYKETFPMLHKTHYAFREGLVDRLVADQLFTKVQEDGQLHTRTLTMSQWSKQPSRLFGSHWTVQVRKPEDLRI
jgi:hypothetical protein